MAPIVKRLGLASTCMASILASLVLATNAANASDEMFGPPGAMQLPATSQPLQSFDISYVDVKTHSYLLADRSNKAIDYFDTLTNHFVRFLIPTSPFAGVVSSPSNASGPNGVLLVTGILAPTPPGCTVACGPTYRNGKPVNMVWATDSPVAGNSGTSSVKVLDLDTGGTIAVLNTLGVRRSDELCQVLIPDPKSPNNLIPDPKNPYVLIANDDPLDNFLTIWRWDNFRFVQRINLNGKDPNAKPYNLATGGTAANGIEQCKFNPRNSHFYLAVPATQTGNILTFGAITPGSGYTGGTYNNVALTGGTGTGATANITVANATSIATLGKITGGTAYTAGTYTGVNLTGGSGSGAKATITVTGGVVTKLNAVTSANSGSGYNIGTYVGVALTDTTTPAATGATATITVANGAINALGAPTGGSGYTNATYNGVALTDLSGTGSGATANIVVSGNAVTTVTLVNRGSGYNTGDVLSAASANIGGGTGFSIPVATLIPNGGVSAISLTAGGSGYVNGDTLTAQLSPTGSGFSVSVNTATGVVTAVTVTTPGTGYLIGDTLSALAADIGGTGSGFSVPVATLGGGVTSVVLVNGGTGYLNTDILSAAASTIGGTGTGFKVAVATVGGVTDDGFVLEISLPVMTATQTVPTKYAQVLKAHDVPSTGSLGGCIGPAGLSIGPSNTSPNPYQAGTVGFIALGCGKTGTGSLVINDNFDAGSAVSVVDGQGADETWYDWFGNHFFFAQSNDPTDGNCVPTVMAGCPGRLSVEDAGGIPPTGSQEDGDGGSQTEDPPATTGTGSHSVAVYPGTCKSPAQPSKVFVPTRSNLTTPNNSPTICSSNGGLDSVGCIAIFTTPPSCGP